MIVCQGSKGKSKKQKTSKKVKTEEKETDTQQKSEADMEKDLTKKAKKAFLKYFKSHFFLCKSPQAIGDASNKIKWANTLKPNLGNLQGPKGVFVVNKVLHSWKVVFDLLAT